MLWAEWEHRSNKIQDPFIPMKPLPSLIFPYIGAARLAASSSSAFPPGFTAWKLLWITRPDKHHPAASEPHPVPVDCTHTPPPPPSFLRPDEHKKQGSSIAVSRPVNLPQGARGSHTFSHMANPVWVLWAELFWDAVRRKGGRKKKKELTVCGKTQREKESRGVLIRRHENTFEQSRT